MIWKSSDKRPPSWARNCVVTVALEVVVGLRVPPPPRPRDPARRRVGDDLQRQRRPRAAAVRAVVPVLARREVRRMGGAHDIDERRVAVAGLLHVDPGGRIAARALAAQEPVHEHWAKHGNRTVDFAHGVASPSRMNRATTVSGGGYVPSVGSAAGR